MEILARWSGFGRRILWEIVHVGGVQVMSQIGRRCYVRADVAMGLTVKAESSHYVTKEGKLCLGSESALGDHGNDEFRR